MSKRQIPQTNQFIERTSIPSRLREIDSGDAVMFPASAAAKVYFISTTFSRFETGLMEWRNYNFRDESKSNRDPVMDMADNALGMVEEVGEISHALLKGRQGIRGWNEDKAIEEIIDGIFDVIIFATNLNIVYFWEEDESRSLSEAITYYSESYLKQFGYSKALVADQFKIEQIIFEELNKKFQTKSNEMSNNLMVDLVFDIFKLSSIVKETTSIVQIFNFTDVKNIGQNLVHNFLNLVIFSMYLCRNLNIDWEENLLRTLDTVIRRDFVKARLEENEQ